MLKMEILNHFVFVLNVFFDFIEVVWGTSVVFFLKVVRVFFLSLGDREDVLDSIGHNEIFVRFQSVDRPFISLRDDVLLVFAVIREVPNLIKGMDTWREGLIAHGSSLFL